MKVKLPILSKISEQNITLSEFMSKDQVMNIIFFFHRLPTDQKVLPY